MWCPVLNNSDDDNSNNARNFLNIIYSRAVMPHVFSLHSKPVVYTFSAFYGWLKLSLRKLKQICSVSLRSQEWELNLKSSSEWPRGYFFWPGKHVFWFDKGKRINVLQLSCDWSKSFLPASQILYSEKRFQVTDSSG